MGSLSLHIRHIRWPDQTIDFSLQNRTISPDQGITNKSLFMSRKWHHFKYSEGYHAIRTCPLHFRVESRHSHEEMVIMQISGVSLEGKSHLIQNYGATLNTFRVGG